MADDTTLNPGTSGDKYRSVQKGGGAGSKTSVVIRDYGGSGAENLTQPPVSATLGESVNQAKSDPTNDEMATGSSAGQIGALLKNRFVTAASNNAANIKSAPGRLYLLDIGSVAAGVIYVKLYDKATAPAPLTDAALLLWVARVIPNVPYLLPFPHGLAFASGLGVAVVTGIGDTDNTPVAASDAAVNVGYK